MRSWICKQQKPAGKTDREEARPLTADVEATGQEAGPPRVRLLRSTMFTIVDIRRHSRRTLLGISIVFIDGCAFAFTLLFFLGLFVYIALQFVCLPISTIEIRVPCEPISWRYTELELNGVLEDDYTCLAAYVNAPQKVGRCVHNEYEVNGFNVGCVSYQQKLVYQVRKEVKRIDFEPRTQLSRTSRVRVDVARIYQYDCQESPLLASSTVDLTVTLDHSVRLDVVSHILDPNETGEFGPLAAFIDNTHGRNGREAASATGGLGSVVGSINNPLGSDEIDIGAGNVTEEIGPLVGSIYNPLGSDEIDKGAGNVTEEIGPLVGSINNPLGSEEIDKGAGNVTDEIGHLVGSIYNPLGSEEIDKGAGNVTEEIGPLVSPINSPLEHDQTEGGS